VKRGVLGFSITKVVHRKDVEDVIAVQSSQSGNTVFYSIKVITDEGKKVLLGNNIAGQRNATALAERIKSDVLGDEVE
jgi:hypothetical protein